MSTRIKIAFACYLLVGLAGMVFGLRYILSPQIMPYHQEVIGVNWGDLSPRIQKMFLAFLHGAGTSMFLSGLSVLILLFIPFRRGEVWSRWALPVLCGPAQIATLCTALDLHRSTHASTPWPFAAFLTVVVLVAIPLSIERKQ
jgi:hypothetical protein